MAAAFPIACLTPPIGVPTRAYLTQTQKYINSNAISIASATDPIFGHLVLVVTSATYAAYGASPFGVPANLGLNPIIIAGATAIVINEANRRHLIERTHYDTYHAADKSIRKQLLEAVPSVYLEEISHETLGFGQVTSLQILDHLWATHGTIDDDQLAQNLETIKTPWQPPTPIETLFTQLKKCQAF